MNEAFYVLFLPQAHLKNVLMACIARRKRYGLKDNQFRHSFGTDYLPSEAILKERYEFFNVCSIRVSFKILIAHLEYFSLAYLIFASFKVVFLSL